MATLSINVFDVASGKMAEGVSVQTRKIVDGEWVQLPDAETQSNGYAKLCEGADLSDGGYYETLIFLGAYFEKTGRDLPSVKLVDILPLRFGLEPATADVSINVSMTPHGYTTSFISQVSADEEA